MAVIGAVFLMLSARIKLKKQFCKGKNWSRNPASLMSFIRKVSCNIVAIWKHACVCRVGGVRCAFMRARLVIFLQILKDALYEHLRSSDTHVNWALHAQVVLTILKNHKPKILCEAASCHEKLFVCSSAILVCSPCVCCSRIWGGWCGCA